MVKKKTSKSASSTRKRKSTKNKRSLSIVLKNLYYLACLLVVFVVLAVFGYNKLSELLSEQELSVPEVKSLVEGKSSKESNPDISSKFEEVRKAYKAKSKSAKTSTDKSDVVYKSLEGFEIPVCNNKKTVEQIITHKGYTVSYNSDYRLANWVAYALTNKEVNSSVAERSNKFVRDPLVKGASAENGDYTRTGYDRGHLAPAGDMKWSSQAMRESFYLSNIAPQKPGLNRGVWKELEEQSRIWAKENGTLLIATGPVLTKDLKRLGKNNVAIPKMFYKVLCMVQKGKYEAVGFLFQNKDYDNISFAKMMLPVDKIEELTNIDFFYQLPDSIENEMEKTVNKSAWSY